VSNKSAEPERATVEVLIEKSEFKELVDTIKNLVKVFAATQIKPNCRVSQLMSIIVARVSVHLLAVVWHIC
jgi:hypothetical protein